MIPTWLEKPKSPSLSTRSSNQGVEEIICNLKDVNKKRIKDRHELTEAKREIENLKEELEELRREVRAGKKNDKDAGHSGKSTHKHEKENQNARSRTRDAEGIDEREEIGGSLEETEETPEWEPNDVLENPEIIEEIREIIEKKKENKLRRWNEKIKRRLNREAKHDPMWDELREELLRDWQKLSRSQVISENEIKDILQDVEEMFINSELEVEKEEIGGSLEETEETPEWEPNDVLENPKIIEEIREIIEKKKGNKLRRWNEKIKRKLNREEKHDPTWDELREDLRDCQKLSSSQVISEDEINDILQDMEEMFINSELEVEKEEIEGGSQEETEETPEWEPDDVLENIEIIEEIREILEEEKAERRSKRRWEKNAWKSIIREHKERKANERVDKKLIKQQLLSKQRKEKERRKVIREVEKRWISALKRNLTERLEERKQKRRDDRLRKLRELIEFVKQERKIMKYKRRAEQEWLEREARSLALYDHQVRMEEREKKKEAKRAFKQELKERNAKLKAEKDRLRETRAKLEEEHKKKKNKAKLEKKRLMSALKDLKRRKRDLGRKRKPKRSEVELQMHDYIWFFLRNPALISMYLRNGPLKRRKKRKTASKATDSQKDIWVWKKNSRGKFVLIERKRIDSTEGRRTENSLGLM
ncbi:trichohyalin-like [Macrobrachium nipponense]|uniref:trichohyalin-like n=1 Tax=Macrobrachium nipponense TaxID=159736 RepID=UPI0030C84517